MWPLVERELRLALRQNAPRHRWFVALIAGGITGLFLIIGALGSANSAGRELFRALLWCGLYVSVLQVLKATSDSFSNERRSGTLSLLFLTGLTPVEIFVSKLAGALVRALCNVLVLFPLLAVPFLSGGISLACFIGAIVCLLNLLFFTLAVTVFASVLCRDDGAALSLSAIVGAVLCGVTPAVWFVVNYLSANSIGNGILAFSPIYAVRLLFLGLPPNSLFEFWRTSATTFCYSAIGLTTAAMVLQRTWQDDAAEFMSAFWRRIFKTQEMHSIRRRWLEQNPFGWLVVRDRTVMKIAAAVLLVIGVLWGTVAALWPRRWATPANALATAALIDTIAMAAITMAAARRFGEDRRAGALELILTTPLDVAEIMGSYHRALREQFRPFVRALYAGNLLLAMIPLLTRPWTPLALLVYVVAWFILAGILLRPLFSHASLAMWVSLNTGRPVHSALRVFNLGWSWIWIIYQFSTARPLFAGFPRGSVGELVFMAVMFFVVLVFVIGGDDQGSLYEFLLARHFRHVSSSPLPSPSDPRWKTWDKSKPILPEV